MILSRKYEFTNRKRATWKNSVMSTIGHSFEVNAQENKYHIVKMVLKRLKTKGNICNRDRVEHHTVFPTQASLTVSKLWLARRSTGCMLSISFHSSALLSV